MGTLEETLARMESMLRASLARLGGMDLDAEDLAELINVNANDGSNDPAFTVPVAVYYTVRWNNGFGVRGEYEPTPDLNLARIIARTDKRHHPLDTVTIVSSTVGIVEFVDGCGHA